jgi:hypothetical protein
MKKALIELATERWIELARHLRSSHQSIACSFPIAGDYIVSTDRGLFRLTKDRIRRLTVVPAFGLAIDGPDMFIATWSRTSTLVLKGKAIALDESQRFGWAEIYRQQVASSAGRVHQIALHKDVLWLANTGQNCLTKLDRQTGSWRANIAPLACAFGGPIWGDNNHINSIMAGPDYVVFSVFKINRRSAIGICGKGRITLFAHPNLGIHDCVIADNELWFSDSYRCWDDKGGGAVFRAGRPVRTDWFDAHPQGFVRGFAGHRGELVIGNSHVGAREERFRGRGHLILLRDGAEVVTLTLPASQIYDIVRRDGRHFDGAAAPDYDSARAAIERALGDPTVEYPIKGFEVSEVGPKFDERDRGLIDELA